MSFVVQAMTAHKEHIKMSKLSAIGFLVQSELAAVFIISGYCVKKCARKNGHREKFYVMVHEVNGVIASSQEASALASASS